MTSDRRAQSARARSPEVPAGASTVSAAGARLPPGRRCCGRSAPLAAAHADAARGSHAGRPRPRLGRRARAHGRAPARRAASSTRGVLAAFAAVPRHLFVDAALATQAYEDTSLPIGHGQTISKPSVVARMLELLLVGASARAPRGGLGACSRSAPAAATRPRCWRSWRARSISVERLKPLHDKARELLAPLRDASPAPRLSATACAATRRTRPTTASSRPPAATRSPPAWLEQLAVGGRLVSPVQSSGGAARCWSSSIGSRAGYDTQRPRGGAVRPPKIRARPTEGSNDRTWCHVLARRSGAAIDARIAGSRSLIGLGRLRLRAPQLARRSRTALRSQRRAPPPRGRVRSPAPSRRRRAEVGQARCPAPRTPASPATTPSSPATR